MVFSDNVVSNVANIEEGVVELAPPFPSEVAVFYYNGYSQELTVPEGVEKIKIEVWGAQGVSMVLPGGKGGYSYGTLNNIRAGDTLYVYVGGRECWNGGGESIEGGGNGGDGTDVRYGGVNFTDRIIVAGGGGGAGVRNPDDLDIGDSAGGGGNGNGGDGVLNCNDGALGGTQTGAGRSAHGWCYTPTAGFGIGGIGDCGGNAAGGGGWYGGGGSGCGSMGGGGSGYIGGVDDGGGENGVREGNGVARICWGDNINKCNGKQPQ
jgi:hypothetical protein